MKRSTGNYDCTYRFLSGEQLSVLWSVCTFLHATAEETVLRLLLSVVFYAPQPLLKGMFLLLDLLLWVRAIQELQVTAERGKHLYLQVGDGLRWSSKCCRGHRAVQQWVWRVAAWRVCGLPVCLQIIRQVFTCILQLVFIQYDVKELLGEEKKKINHAWCKQQEIKS